MKILIIIGSPKKHSFNYLFSQYAYQYLKKYCEVSYLDYHDLPYISSDNQYDFIETVEREDIYCALTELLDLIPPSLSINKEKLLEIFDLTRDF